MKTAALGRLADFINGAAFRPEDWHEQGLPIIRIQNLTDPSKPFNRTQRKVSEKLHVFPGDVLVSWSATLGVFEWPRAAGEALVNQHIFRVVPRTDRVDKRYLMHVLTGALAAMGQHLHGATMKHVNRAQFLATEVPLPPIEEQRRIAAVLDQADILRAKRRSIQNLQYALDPAMFAEIVGDPRTNPHGWPVVQLTSVVEHGDRINYGVVQPGPHVSDGVPLIRVSDLAGRTVSHDQLKRIGPKIDDKYRRSRLRGNEVLVSCVGSVGIIALASERERGFNIARAVARIPLRRSVSPAYVAAYLSTPLLQSVLERELRTVAQPTLNIKQITELPLLLPPAEVQSQFDDVIRITTRQQDRLDLSVRLFDELFASLQQRAFAGQL